MPLTYCGSTSFSLAISRWMSIDPAKNEAGLPPEVPKSPKSSKIQLAQVTIKWAQFAPIYIELIQPLFRFLWKVAHYNRGMASSSIHINHQQASKLLQRATIVENLPMNSTRAYNTISLGKTTTTYCKRKRTKPPAAANDEEENMAAREQRMGTK